MSRILGIYLIRPSLIVFVGSVGADKSNHMLLLYLDLKKRDLLRI